MLISSAAAAVADVSVAATDDDAEADSVMGDTSTPQWASIHPFACLPQNILLSPKQIMTSPTWPHFSQGVLRSIPVLGDGGVRIAAKCGLHVSGTTSMPSNMFIFFSAR